MRHPGGKISRSDLALFVEQLPTLPALTIELFASFDQENIDVATLTLRLSNDQGLVARALRIANSPFYGLSGKVSSIHDAVIVLGFQAVRFMVVSAAIVNSLSAMGRSLMAEQVYWKRSIAVALCARHLAKILNKNPEICFTAGLLHGIGKVVLESYCGDRYAATLAWRHEQDLLLCQAEQEMLGVTNTYAGALLAKQWGLPENLVESIELYSSPPDDAPNALIDIVHIADVLAVALELSGDESEAVPPLSSTAWQRSGIDWQVLPELFHEVDSNMDATCNMLLAGCR